MTLRPTVLPICLFTSIAVQAAPETFDRAKVEIMSITTVMMTATSIVAADSTG